MTIETSEARLIASRVSEGSRMGLLPELFGIRVGLRVESAIYFWLAELSGDYSGGYWDMYRLNNGGFFMVPPARQYTLHCPNDYTGTVGAEAAGITAALYALSHLSFAPGMEQVGDYYHRLRPYAAEHAQARAIFAAID